MLPRSILKPTISRLYHPRNDQWGVHFQLDGELIVPLTAIGRVTEYLLHFNSRDQRIRRAELIKIGESPCRLKNQPNGR